jgi:hypothetical protein
MVRTRTATKAMTWWETNEFSFRCYPSSFRGIPKQVVPPDPTRATPMLGRAEFFFSNFQVQCDLDCLLPINACRAQLKLTQSLGRRALDALCYACLHEHIPY